MVLEPMEMYKYLEDHGGFPRDVINEFFNKHVTEGKEFLESLKEGDSFYIVIDKKDNHNSFTIYNISDDDDVEMLFLDHIVATDVMQLLKEVLAH